MSCRHPCAPRRHGPLHNGPWSWAKATLASECESTSRVTAVVHAVVPCRQGTWGRFVCAPVSLIAWPGRKTSPKLGGNQLVLVNKPHASPQRSGTGWRIKAEASHSSKMQARGALCWCWRWDLGASHQGRRKMPLCSGSLPCPSSRRGFIFDLCTASRFRNSM